MTESTTPVAEELSRSHIETRLIQRAMQDPTFRQTLIQEPQRIWQQEFGNTVIQNLQLQVLEDTETSLYLVVPAHDQTLRQELLDHPQTVWQREFGNLNLQGAVIRVIQELDGCFCLVLPWQERTAGWIEDLPQILEPGWQAPDIQTVTGWKVRQRPLPKSKLGRIGRRLQTWGVMLVKRNPLVTAILRPFYWMRSLIQAWKRL